MNGKNITEKHLKRLENLIELVEDEYGEYDDSLCDELLEFVRSSVQGSEVKPIKKEHELHEL